MDLAKEICDVFGVESQEIKVDLIAKDEVNEFLLKVEQANNEAND